MKTIRPTTSEELSSQSEAGRTSGKSICPHTVVCWAWNL